MSIKQKTYTIYNIYDVDGELTITMSRKDAKEAFKKGMQIYEHKVTDCRVSTKVSVSTTVSKEW